MSGEQAQAQDVSISKCVEGSFSNRLFKNPEDKLGRRFNKEGNDLCFVFLEQLLFMKLRHTTLCDITQVEGWSKESSETVGAYIGTCLYWDVLFGGRQSHHLRSVISFRSILL